MYPMIWPLPVRSIMGTPSLVGWKQFVENDFNDLRKLCHLDVI